MYGNRSLLFIHRKYNYFCHSTRLHETSQLFVYGYFQQVKGIAFLAEKLFKLKTERSQHDNMMYFESKMDELQENLQHMAHSKSKMDEWQENLQHSIYSESKLEEWQEDLQHLMYSESKMDELQEDMTHSESKTDELQEDMTHSESKTDELKEDTESKMDELQKDTKSKMDELQEDTESKMDELKEDTESKMDEFQEDTESKMDEFQEDTESKMDELKEDTESKIDEFQEDTESKMDEFQEDTESKMDEFQEDTESKMDEFQEDTESKMDELQGDLQHLASFIDFLMVKRFLKLEVDENGKKIPVNVNSPDYYLFKSSIPDKLNEDFMTKELKEEFMTKHYHKYPLIHIDFNCEENSINCMHDALSFCRSIIHECYEDCKYLINSDSLSEEEKELCGKWCDENQFYNFDEDDICQSFKQLSSYLRKHHKCRVIFLVEDLNSMATEAKFNVIDIKEAQDVINLNEKMVNSIKMEKNENVLYEFMTEILYPGAVRILGGVNYDT